MIIDVILDRRAGDEYTTNEMRRLYDYAMDFKFWDLAEALDCGDNKDIQRELCQYISDQNYCPTIIDYINSVDWVAEQKGFTMTFEQIKNSLERRNFQVFTDALGNLTVHDESQLIKMYITTMIGDYEEKITVDVNVGVPQINCICEK